MNNLRNQYPINTFTGTTQDELVNLIANEVIKALWDLHEYMGQFPDALNLAVMAERIKLTEEELKNDTKS